jgi:putative CocE/NonD family hydrolase
VLVDARGTGTSEGEWAMLSLAEQHDCYDVVEWIAAQPWSAGKVGMIGQSYFGFIQWLAAAQRPPHLTCIAPYDALVDPYRDMALHGGIPCLFPSTWSQVLRLNHTFGPRSELGGPDFAVDPHVATIEHPVIDAFWDERTVYDRLHEIDIPVLSVGNWGKNSLHARGNVLGFERVSGFKQLRMEAGAVPGSLNVAKALLDFDSIELHETVLAPWYDHWLKGEDNGVLDRPAVSLFVSGIDADRDYDQWPPPGMALQPFALCGARSGSVTSLNDGGLDVEGPAGPESFSYTYPDPLWHLGTATVTSLGVPNPISRILTFTSRELEHDLEVIGPARLRLFASSDQVDTDFVVRLSDQVPTPATMHPELAPPAVVVSRGWLRASHRELDDHASTELRPHHSHRDPQPLVPEEVYAFEIELMPLAHVFRAGHRIRLELANGDSPVSEAIFAHYYTLWSGTDTIHHSDRFPSTLFLPVVPATG